MKAVILAGGFGTRLRPLTVNAPKPMVPFANRPMMQHVVRLLKKHGLDDLVVILYHQPDAIRTYFGDGSAFGVHIEYVVSGEDLGTAGAVGLARALLQDTFLVIAADIVTDIDLSQAIQYHHDHQADATITLSRVDDPLEYGIVITDSDGHIVRFLEKPSWGEVFSDTVNTGIYVLEPSIWQEIPEGREVDFSKNVFPSLLTHHRPLFGYIAPGYWCDVGNIREYKHAHSDVLKGKVDLEPQGERIGRIGSDIWVGDDSKIASFKGFDGSVLIGRGASIGEARIQSSFVGDHVSIQNGAVVENSILWEGATIESGARVFNSIVGKNVHIGKDVLLEGDNIVADDCNVGQGSTLKSQVQIWPGKIVEAGSIVTSNVVWGKAWSRALFGSYGIVGVNNIEVTPEMCAKLGCAYGTYLGKGSIAFTARDDHQSSRMLKRSVIGGLMSTGVRVLDLQAAPVPLARFAVKSVAASGGVHVMRSPFDRKLTTIRFYDRSGFDLSTAQEASIERIFFREEFARADVEEVGTIDIPPRVVESYRDFYLNSLDIPLIQSSGIRFVIDYSYGTTVQFFPAIAGEFGLEMISLNAYADGRRAVRTASEFRDARRKLSAMVKSLEASFGVILDASGEKIFLVDSTGEIISDTRATAIMIGARHAVSAMTSVTLPVTASIELEQYLRGLGIDIHWCSTLPRSIVRETTNTDAGADMLGGFIFSRSLPFYDGMLSIGLLLETLARTEKDLTALKHDTPSRDPGHVELPCPWELKGTIMRRLSEAARDSGEFIEGVKLRESDGYTLVTPDRDRAVLHIYASYTTVDREQARLKDMEAQVRSWQA
ncbi:MAG TPA: sugar phosphate nucleotidyltransferase [Candidatus Cryosericum sp.]|nr:sugar phosphate nucleotidyltransferase [Candidatus Cryosericum sp.]